jgi:hypothetical protein
MYDFRGVNMNDLREQAKKMEEEQKGMKKKVNERAMGVIEECVCPSWIANVAYRGLGLRNARKH